MFKQVRRWIPERTLIFVGDSSFAVLELLNAANLLAQTFVVSRLRLDAALYAPAPERRPHQLGRPGLKGDRLPTLKDVFNDAQQLWQSVMLPNWYGHTEREIEYLSATAVWYHTGNSPVPLRWVLVRDPKGEFIPQSFLCTPLEAAPMDILMWFCRRWYVEVTVEEMRAHLGMETQRQWSELAIARTTPVLLGLFSILTLMADALQFQQSFLLSQTAW
jgi:hypothetical protein